MDSANAFPAFGEKSDGVGDNLNDFAGFMDIGATPRQEMAKLVTCDMAIPFAWCTMPDAALRLAIRTFMQNEAANMGFPFDHAGDHPPIL